MGTKNEKEQNSEFQLLGELIEQKQQYRKIIKAAVTHWVKDFQDGRVQIQTVEDLRTLMQIELELQNSIRLDQSLRDRKISRG